VKRFHAVVRAAPRLAAALVAASLVAACTGDDGDQGPPGPPGPPGGATTPTDLQRTEDSPGVNVAILAVTGASNSDGSFAAGDTPTVKFTLTKNDGSSWTLAEMSRGRIMLSGPTFNYQQVIPEVSDVPTRAVENADGSFSYTFATGLPATYPPPINDTLSFGSDDGELQGQTLLAGTYTIGISARWDYTVEGQGFNSAGNAEFDVLVDNATTIAPREVVTQANCATCHSDLSFHGGLRKDVKLCILCHTAGAEDENDSGVGGGTPDATIEFKVMIHKIHNAAHLPSVNGIGVLGDGTRDYSVPPKPYELAGNGNLSDFSTVHFPVWPSLNIPMPRNTGYTLLTAEQQGRDDTVREGVVSCDKCHGDPDGAGPLPPPADGDLAYAQPSRKVCGSCHDDVVWTQSYKKNNQMMGAQLNDSSCIFCHPASGGSLSVRSGHLHPLLNPSINPGFHVTGLTVAESGTNNADGTIDPGEQIALTFSLTDDSGADVPPSTVTSLNAALSGPTTNPNMILNTSIPTAMLTGAPPFTVDLSEVLPLEFLGKAANNGGIEVFATSRHPIYTGSTTTVFERTATSGGNSTLAAPVGPPQNFIEVVDATGFAHNDYAVIDDGVLGAEEYLRVQYVDGNRLWFGSTASTSYAVGPRLSHPAGSSVKEVTLTTKTLNTDYVLDLANGTITEVAPASFQSGDAIVCTYTSFFVMPATFPTSINGSPDLDASWGKWTGLALPDGTYTVGLWGAPPLVVDLNGESQNYNGTSPPAAAAFLAGSASTIDPYDKTAGAATCYACHDDVYFHGGGRRGYETCLLCHGTAGSEDRPPYVAANAPPTTGLTVDFRTLLHKIHMGARLANADTYEVVGFGSTAYPDNFGTSSYSEVVFPAMPAEAATCVACHGADNTAFFDVAERNHPAGQTPPTRAWRAACGACHDSTSAQAHIDVNTSPAGFESCEVCHGDGRPEAVQVMHKPR
jgi:OmcA/MtrC family decaheme c-type cytochrome